MHSGLGSLSKRARTCPTCEITVASSPLSAELVQGIHGCIREVYGDSLSSNSLCKDQLQRMQEEKSIYAFASSNGEVVSLAVMQFDGSVGLLTNVCTKPAHQREGLAKELIRRLLELAVKPRWLVLSTGSQIAASIFCSHGFRGLNGGLRRDPESTNNNADDEGQWIMVRDSDRPGLHDAVHEDNEAFDLASYVLPGDIVVEPLGRSHLGAAVLLLNMLPGAMKLSSLGIKDGLTAEPHLVQAIQAGDKVTVAVHAESRRIFGIAFHHPTAGLEAYTIGPSSINAALVSGSAGPITALPSTERTLFWERGYLVFEGLLAEEAPAICSKMDVMMGASSAECTLNWNAVDTGGATPVLAVDDGGGAIPGRILKVQGAALGSAAVLEALGSDKIREKIKALYSYLGQDVPEHVDVFGTKFFPMWPGGVSVSWHQDCHYFGTASPRIISCGIYLEDTDTENGCLQVIPGSHTRGLFQHSPGKGEQSQGEWASIHSDAEVVDVVVPAGTVVLFNAMLMHGARKNRHPKRTRYSVFGHYLPASLGFSWRGTDFSHGVYLDRHTVY